MSDCLGFSNGLSAEDSDKLEDLRIDLVRLRLRIEELGRHRNYSLALTALEEAGLWLADRKHKAA